VLTTLVGGTLALVAFAVHQARTGHPLVPPQLFRHRSFTVATVAGLLFSAGAFGAVFLLSQFLQISGGYSPLAAGVCTLPWTAAPMLIAPFTGPVTARIGVRPLLVSGLVALAGGIAWMSPLVTHATMVYVDYVPGLLLAGIGMGLIFAPSSTAVLAGLPDTDHGTASSVNATARELGTAIGIAVLVAVFEATDGRITPTGFGHSLQLALVVAAAVVAVAALVAALMPARTGRRDSAAVAAREVEPALT
jgi:MFS family permease